MSPPTQLVNPFSPNPNDTHSGRITPSSVGGVNSGKSSALTTDSNATGAVSLDMQQNHTICPIPRQGSYVGCITEYTKLLSYVESPKSGIFTF